jgi:hypothetical protein
MHHRAVTVLLLLLAGCATPANPLPQPTGWKAVLIAGDDAEPAFNNAVEAMADKLVEFGIERDDIAILEASGVNAPPADDANIRSAFSALGPAATDGCFIFVTSHGHPQRGLVMKAIPGFLAPGDLGGYLDRACGERPTVVVASGCFSGMYANGRALTATNRTILTAARADRTSFGCSANRQFTIFDECLLGNLDRGLAWQTVMERTRACVTRQEQENAVQPPSAPQIFVGRDVEQLRAFPG